MPSVRKSIVLGADQPQPGLLAVVLATWLRRLVMDGRRHEKYRVYAAFDWRIVQKWASSKAEMKDNVTRFPTARRHVDGIENIALAAEKVSKNYTLGNLTVS